MFDYNYFRDFIAKLMKTSPAPLQLELQPGEGCGGYNCGFCYGYNQRLTSGKDLSLKDYYALLDDLKGRVGLITMAGIKSDPLNNKNTYQIIKRLKENGLRLGIHTKGFLLNKHLADLLNTNTAYGDFITISVDASDSAVYNSLHGLPKGGRFFGRVIENVKYLYARKKKARSGLNVNVSYLLFKQNSSMEQMERFVRIFGEACDTIRFSPPQLPNKVDSRPDYYLDSLTQVRKTVNHLRRKYHDKKIVFLDIEDSSHTTDFKYCYMQRFLAVIDSRGWVYPCPQITTEKFKPIAYGNIRNKGFWEIWDSKRRKRTLDMEVERLGCRICDRKDEALNMEFGRIFKNERIS